MRIYKFGECPMHVEFANGWTYDDGDVRNAAIQNEITHAYKFGSVRQYSAVFGTVFGTVFGPS